MPCEFALRSLHVFTFLQDSVTAFALTSYKSRWAKEFSERKETKRDFFLRVIGSISGNSPASISLKNRGPKKHINFFKINFLAPTQNPVLGPHQKEKRVVCLISWERMQKRDPHKLFRADFGVKKRGPKRAIFGHKSLVSYSLPALKEFRHFLGQKWPKIGQTGSTSAQEPTQ